MNTIKWGLYIKFNPWHIFHFDFQNLLNKFLIKSFKMTERNQNLAYKKVMDSSVHTNRAKKSNRKKSKKFDILDHIISPILLGIFILFFLYGAFDLLIKK